MEIFTNISNHLSSIADSLLQLLSIGVPIMDSYAPITTMVNITTTFIGSCIGALFTMYLFKYQERIKVKENIRLDFYKQYSLLYVSFRETVIELCRVINPIISPMNIGNRVSLQNGTHSGKRINTRRIKKFIEYNENVQRSYLSLKYHIDANKFLLKNSHLEIYSDLDLKIKGLKEFEDYILKYYSKEGEYDKNKTISRSRERDLIDLNDFNILTDIDDIEKLNNSITKDFLGEYFNNAK